MRVFFLNVINEYKLSSKKLYSFTAKLFIPVKSKGDFSINIKNAFPLLRHAFLNFYRVENKFSKY